MTTSFHICIASRNGSHRMFAEVAGLLRASLADLGLKSSQAVNQIRPGRVNILLNYHQLELEPDEIDGPYVVYQLEQLDAEKGWYGPKAEALLEGAGAVWDYAPENMAFLKQRGIKTFFLPPGYHPAMRTLSGQAGQDIDVLFYGTLNVRRLAVLQALNKAGVQTEVLTGAYGQERDRLVGRARIVLNLHFHPMNILETVRISHLLTNRAFVVSEESAGNTYEKVGLMCVPYERIPGACLSMLERAQARERLRERNHTLFKEHFPMPRLLADVLKGSGL